VRRLVLLTLVLVLGADWPRFRGPDATGISDERGLPTTWSATENVVWKTPMPGAGSSSPIVLGDRVLLTCYSGYGLDEDEPGAVENLQHHLVCVDRTTGKIVWDQVEKAQMPEKQFRSYVALHGYASGTPVTDGQNVYAFFGRSGVFACTLAGQRLWQAGVGDGLHDWGSGTSPILCKNLVIVNASIESESLVALDKSSGKEVWRVEGILMSWSTPVVVDLPGGAQELVVQFKDRVLGIDPATGKQLWQCAGVPDYVCPALVADKGIVYVTGGRKPQTTLAIRAGGRGDVTETHRLWVTKKTPKVATPLVHEGLVYFIDQRGAALCLNAQTGDVVYEERMEIAGRGDKVYASLVLADGKLYGVTREDGTVVLAPGPEFKVLARNRLDDPSISNGTPAIAGGRLLLRSNRFLYCIGK